MILDMVTVSSLVVNKCLEVVDYSFICLTVDAKAVVILDGVNVSAVADVEYNVFAKGMRDDYLYW